MTKSHNPPSITTRICFEISEKAYNCIIKLSFQRYFFHDTWKGSIHGPKQFKRSYGTKYTFLEELFASDASPILNITLICMQEY